MKLVPLALAASFLVAGYAHAQTAAPAPAQPTQSASSSGGKISHDCKSEIHKLCGHSTDKDAMKGCVKDNLDMNKFSANCATELKSHAEAPAKPAS
jgi:hypothetical protein